MQAAAGGLGGQAMAERLAARLAATAHRQSEDRGFVSPFAVERRERAAAEGEEVPGEGGKQDDVTVVVALVEG